jgi:hypothetical protein
MNEHDRMKELLQQALPPVESEAAPSRDLWPAVLRRLDANPDANPGAKPANAPHPSWIWFDCALAAGLVALVAVFPAAIPVLLYYL